MTDIELHYPRSHAVELVKATFERLSSFAYYESDEDDQVIIGTTTGGVTSFGEQIVVRIPTEQPERSTTISVTAKHQLDQNRTANPWKYKSVFMDELHSLRQTSIEEVRQTTPTVGQNDGERGFDSKSVATTQANVTPEDMMESAAVILRILLVLVFLVFIAIIVILLPGL